MVGEMEERGRGGREGGEGGREGREGGEGGREGGWVVGGEEIKKNVGSCSVCLHAHDFSSPYLG